MLAQFMFPPSFTEQRLYWADDSLDKIESMDPDNSTDRIILLSVTAGSTLDLFPFGLALHYDDVYFSDINSRLVIFVDSSSGEVKVLPSLFSLPVEVHIYIGKFIIITIFYNFNSTK